MNNKNKILAALALTAGSAVFLFVALFIPITITTKNIAEISHILPPDQFEDVELLAEAAFVYKPESGEVLYTKNEDVQLALASIAKVMAAIVVSEYMEPEMKVALGTSDWKLKDLLDYTLVVSSNDGADALAAAAAPLLARDMTFLGAMNGKAEALGLKQTYFLTPSGLDTSDTFAGAYGSAKDVATLFAYALKHAPEYLEATTLTDTRFKTIDGGEQPAINTNEAIGAIPGLIAGKTGFTDLAGGNLVVAFDAGLNDPTIIVVLGSTKEGRFEDVRKLVRATLRSDILR